jgi:hypothetical protein
MSTLRVRCGSAELSSTLAAEAKKKTDISVEKESADFLDVINFL